MTTEKSEAKEDRRAAIVEAARARFRASGVEGTTLEMVANDAGLPRPHLYRYFKDKAGLVAAVVSAEAAEVNRRRAAKVATLQRFDDKIVQGIQAAVELVHGDPYWASLVAPEAIPYTAYVAIQDPELLASNRGFWAPILRTADDLGDLRVGLDHEEVMTWLLGMEFMFLERREFFPTGTDVGHYARTFIAPALVSPTAAADLSETAPADRVRV